MNFDLSLNNNNFQSAEKLKEIKDESNFCSTWGCTQIPMVDTNLPPVTLSNNSLRQIIHISSGGEKIRIKFSNRFGNDKMEIISARIANSAGQGTGEIVLETNTKIYFKGEEGTSISAGEEIYCDLFNYHLIQNQEVTISIYFGKVPSNISGHPLSCTNSFINEGNKVDEKIFSFSNKCSHWYIIAGVEVLCISSTKAIICFGDSITDGSHSDIDKQQRLSDFLSLKLSKSNLTSHLAVVNQGLAGSFLSISGLERFSRDVIDQKGVTYIIVLYGINDINKKNAKANEIISAYPFIVKKKVLKF